MRKRLAITCPEENSPLSLDVPTGLSSEPVSGDPMADIVDVSSCEAGRSSLSPGMASGYHFHLFGNRRACPGGAISGIGSRVTTPPRDAWRSAP